MSDQNKSTGSSPGLNNSGASSGSSSAEQNNDPNNKSIINKVRSRMSSILPSTISSWFSPSNGRRMRRRRSNDSDDSVVAEPAAIAGLGAISQQQQQTPVAHVSAAGAASLSRNGDPFGVAQSNWTAGVPPTKRQKFVASTDEMSFARDIGHMPFTYSTPAPASLLLGQRLHAARADPLAKPYPYDVGSTFTRPAIGQRPSTAAHHDDVDDDDDGADDLDEDDDDDEDDTLALNGLDRQAELTGSERRRFLVNHQQAQRSQSGSRAGVSDAGSAQSSLNFNNHLQTQKSLFAGAANNANRSASLNASTTSLNSLAHAARRRRTIYGSTSALSDSRLLSGTPGATSPFYNGRTMYGGASAYSAHQRAALSTKALRIPTQMRSASSLSARSSPAASVAGVVGDAAGSTAAGAQTSALSNTARRILDLMNQFSTPLNDARKMNSTVGAQPAEVHGHNGSSAVVGTLPSLVAHRRRFDETDMLANRSLVRLNRPHTPYTRQIPQVQPQKPASTLAAAMANELQVPTMSTLMQMKKVLQNKTERNRELASTSNSILNRNNATNSNSTAAAGQYTLPNANAAAKPTEPSKSSVGIAVKDAAETSSTACHGESSSRKMRNKITINRPSQRNATDDDLPEPVNLPSVQLQFPSDVAFSLGTVVPFSKPALSSVSPAVNAKPSSPDAVKSSTVSPPHTNFSFAPFKPAPAAQAPEKSSAPAQKSFAFATPLPVRAPAFVATIEPINQFKFSQPISVAGSGQPSALAAAAPKLRSGSVLDVLQSKPSTSSASAATLPSLNAIFASASNEWECDACMLKNKPDRTKCIACETPKVAAAQTTKTPSAPGPSTFPASTFGQQFAPKSDTWECEACMVRNKADVSKCVACSTAKKGAAAATSSASTGFSFGSSVSSASFGDAFKPASTSWECDACMVRNKADATKCVACETSKPGTGASASSSFGGFGAAFKPAASTWECDACMVRNKADASKCVACSTPKTGAASTVGASVLPGSGFSFGSTTGAKSSDSGFASLLAKQNAKWECGACMTRNDAALKKCECCEQDKPGESSASASASPFGNTPAALSLASASSSKFSFGVPFNANAPTSIVAPLKAAASEPATKTATTFTFGTLPPAAPVSSTSIDAVDVGTPKPVPSSVEASALCKADTIVASPSAFGSFSVPAVTSQSSPAAASASLATAVPKSPAKATPSAPTFAFGSSASAPSGFSFGGKTNAEPSSDESPAKKRATASTLEAPTSHGFSLSDKTTAPVSTTASTGAFSFGAKPADETKTVKAPVTNGISQPTAGKLTSLASSAPTTLASSTISTASFVFGSPSTTTTTAKPAAASFIFGSSAAVKPVPNTGFQFGDKPAAASPIKGILSFSNTAPASNNAPAATAASAAQPGGPSSTATPHSFGGSTLFGAASAANTASVPAAAPTSFVFGSSAANAAIPAMSLGQAAFGGSANATPNKPTAFGGFASANATGTFGAASASNAAPASGSFVFGQTAAAAPVDPSASSVKPSATNPPEAAPAFSFGNAATQPAATQSAPNNMFTFGSAASGSASPASLAFGGKPPASLIADKPPAFSFGGSSTGGSATASSSVADSKSPFNFSGTGTPIAFNFSATSQTNAAPVAAQPFKFGSSVPASSGLFSFGASANQETTTPGTQFQLSSDPAGVNIFQPAQSTTANAASAAIQQRRKVRAVRRNIR